MLTHFLNTHFLYQLIGSGFYSTISISIANNIAHNDFIEYLVDFGLIGLSLWLIVLFKFYMNIQKIKSYEKYLYVLLVFCVIILVGRGLFAGTIRTDNIYLSISLGYLLAAFDQKYYL